MQDTRQVEQDLQYVRSAVERRAQAERMPTVIAGIWATIILVGFSLNDFYPAAGATYWIVMLVVGWIASAMIGSRLQRRYGELDRREGRRHALHWAGLAVAWGAVPLLVVSGNLKGAGAGQTTLLLVTVFYYLGGVHFDRFLMLPAGVMLAGYVALTFDKPYTWTAIAVVVFLVMLGGALLRARNNVATATTG